MLDTAKTIHEIFIYYRCYDNQKLYQHLADLWILRKLTVKKFFYIDYPQYSFGLKRIFKMLMEDYDINDLLSTGFQPQQKPIDYIDDINSKYFDADAYNQGCCRCVCSLM